MDYSEATWDLHTLLFQCSCYRGLSNETPDRRRVKNACAIWQAHGQFLNQAHKGCVLLDVSHMPPAILSVFSYSGSSELKRVRLRVRSGLLPSLITTIKKRAVIPSTGSLFSFLFLFWKLHLLHANLDALKMLLDYPLPEVTWKAVDLRVLDRVEGTVAGTGADTQTLCLGFHAENRKEHLIFFRLIGENHCRCITRNTEKKLAWPYSIRQAIGAGLQHSTGYRKTHVRSPAGLRCVSFFVWSSCQFISLSEKKKKEFDFMEWSRLEQIFNLNRFN